MTNVNKNVQNMVISALLCAVGIVIPMFAPKIVIGPMSFTLASHVAIFIAMFISPVTTVAVCVVTSIGFVFAGLPFVVAARAMTHIIFAFFGSIVLKKHPTLLYKPVPTGLFGFLCSVVHAAGEVVVVSVLYFGDSLSADMYASGYLMSVLLLVGVGTVVHSMVDFFISVFVWKPVSRIVTIPVSFRPERRSLSA